MMGDMRWEMGREDGRSAVVSMKASDAKSETESDSAVEQRFGKHDRSSTDAWTAGRIKSESSQGTPERPPMQTVQVARVCPSPL